jgi:hypothetical protein
MKGTFPMTSTTQDNPAEVDRKVTLTEAFEQFHSANRHVAEALRDLAFDWLNQGKAKCSITLLYNVVRWKMSLEVDGDGEFQLNDHYQAFYARALMIKHPELSGMFNLRSAPEADAYAARLRAQFATYRSQA